ncbi:hypothetical protein DL96DRAFT_1631891 [Flagelloscypha sp. PMI_526]|nr:hypothetical protein DL96DRAFT_1631891 [Flagelloscypha sp. PMI_526]
MENFANIPVEVARLIIENATSNQSTATALSCVSREIQLWSDSVLFRNIVIESTNWTTDSIARFVRSYISDNPSPRIYRARSFVKTFAVKQSKDNGDDQILRFVSLSSAIHTFCLWTINLTPPFFTLDIPSLRRISFPCFNGIPKTFKDPLFHSITHLELGGLDHSYDEGLTFWNKGMSSMPSLTHLILNVEEDCISFLLNIVARIPSQLELLLVLHPGELKNRLSGVPFDERVIMGVLVRFGEPPLVNGPDEEDLFLIASVWHSWSGQIPEENTIWARAERMLKKKREKQVS